MSLNTVGLVLGALGVSELVFKIPSTTTKRIRDWSGNNNDSSNNHRNNQSSSSNTGTAGGAGAGTTGMSPTHQSIIPMTEDRLTAVHLISQRQEASLSRQILGYTSAAVVVYIVYSYYLGSANTKRVIDKVEDTAQETQELVRDCDDNNQRRIEELDERAEERTNDLSVEIRGEQRAHFEVLSKQLNCVTQVCLQTINAIANGATGSSEDGEVAGPNEQLIAYAEKAQEMSDSLFDRDTYLKTVDMHIDECRAQIGARKKSKMKGASTQPDMDDIMIAGGMTAGGSDDADNELDQTGSSPFIRKVSGPGMAGRSDSKNSKGNNDSKSKKSLTEYQFVKNLKLGYFTEYYALQYIDPVYLFLREHQKAIFTTMLIGVAAAGAQHYKKRETKPQRSFY